MEKAECFQAKKRNLRSYLLQEKKFFGQNCNFKLTFLNKHFGEKENKIDLKV